MSKLNMFIPITKVDAVERLVYGIATAEQVDKSNEVCDYATTKPLYEKWSSEFHKATDGKSLGNVRVMHGNAAVGKLTALNFNDEAKQIEICAKVVDDNEWAKVQEGVYTGFSQGGRYLKRWKDKDNDKLMRYTAEPTEVSLVDNPCLPTATFTMIKQDGAEELRKFTSVLPEEKKPEADAVVEEPIAKADVPAATEDDDDFEQVWVTKRLPGKEFSKKADMFKAITEAEAEDKVKALIAPLTKTVDEIKAALTAKEPQVEKTDEPTKVEPTVDEVRKAKLDKAKGLVVDFRKSFHASKEEKELSKGVSLYGAANLLQLLAAVASAEDDLEYPSYGTTVDKAICDRFGKVVVDLGEVISDIIAKLLSDMKDSEMSEVMAMAAKMGELIKIGARNSKSDKEKIQAIHDHAGALGAECEATKAVGTDDLTKAFNAATAENAALTKALAGIPAVLDELMKRVKNIEAQPFVMPPHSGVVVGKNGRVVNANGDPAANGLLTKATEELTAADLDELAKIAIKHAHQNPNTRNT